MKKLLIYLSVTAGLCLVFGITSRLSVGFSEWYAMNIYPVLVTTVGRFFGFFSFSVAEIVLILMFPGVVAGTVLFIIKMVKGKGRRRKIFLKTGICTLCIVSTFLLNFILACGINYNRRTFLYDQDISFYRTELDEWLVFQTLLDEFHETFPNIESAIATNADGEFRLVSDLSSSTPIAMRNLAEQFPRLQVYYPRPKPTKFIPPLMALGFYFPLTMEANYNNTAPDGQRAMVALHELAHVAGFMREDEANFIAFLAGRESGNPELMYAAYLFVFDNLDKLWQTQLSEERYNEFRELLPRQIQIDLQAQNRFWFERFFDIEYIYDDYGNVIGTTETVNPVAEAVFRASETVNDAYLRTQGQEDGILSYGRMIDLVMAVYLYEHRF